MGDVADAAREFVDAFNSHDEARIREGYADDVKFEAPGAEGLSGADGATQYSMGYIRAFPDVRLTATNQIEAGEWIALEFTYDGTHTGPLATPDGNEIPPTNRHATGKGVDVLRIIDGKTVEEHLYFDQLEFLTQLGLVPEAATS